MVTETLRNSYYIILHKHAHSHRDAKSLQNGKNRKSDDTPNSILMQVSGQIGEHAHTHARVYTRTFGRVTGSCTIIQGKTCNIGRTKTKNNMTFWCFARLSLRTWITRMDRTWGIKCLINPEINRTHTSLWFFAEFSAQHQVPHFFFFFF